MMARADTVNSKAGRWNDWYTEAIPLAEHRYEMYLKERAEHEGRQS